MKRILFITGVLSLFLSTSLKAQDVVDIAISSADHSTLVAAVKAAELVETLKGEGPFTIFAPTNAAFDALPEGTVAQLLTPSNQAQLSSILTYHVLPGNLDAAAVIKAIQENEGALTVSTVNGTMLTAKIEDGTVILIDAKGKVARITQTDLVGSNGVVHVIDTVLMPE